MHQILLLIDIISGFKLCAAINHLLITKLSPAAVSQRQHSCVSYSGKKLTSTLNNQRSYIVLSNKPAQSYNLFK